MSTADFIMKFPMTKLKFIIIMTNEHLFDVIKDINILRQFFKKCKFNKNNWNLTDIETPILNSKKEGNYSDIIFKRNFAFLTRLDIKKR